VPEVHNGTGFEIIGGEGYLVTAPQPTTTSFSGLGWLGEQPIVPLNKRSGTEISTAIMGIYGDVVTPTRDRHVMAPVTIEARLLVTNEMTGATSSTWLNQGNGHFSGALIDISGGTVTSIGDLLRIELARPDGSLIGESVRHYVSADEIEARYIAMGPVAIELPPLRTLVERSFPNPFNPQTKIRFQLAKPGRATLKVFDVRGRLVRTLIDKNMPAGYYEQIWLGRDNKDRRVASGVYLYRFTAPDYEQSRKMVLIK